MASRGKMMGKTSFDTIEDNAHGYASMAVTELYTSSPNESYLVEPGLQDVPRSCRDYIRYFHQELSKECVVYSNSSFNPFLSLMPLAPSSQALSHIMISISAFHIAHRLDISQAQLQPGYSEVVRIALLNKQKALRYLKHELRVQPEINTDAVIAAVLLFVNLDVVEFGGRGWKYHLRGAEELIRIRKGLVVDDSENWLQFGILGSTLVPSHSLRVAPMPLDTGLLDTLRRSEQQTWIGCPADLLSLLHVMNTLRAVSDHSSHADETVTSILDGLDNFSPRSWAHDFPDPQHYESRYHLAHAYKAAVSVYAVQIIAELSSPPSSFFSDAFRLIELGISHMSQIQASDFHIKSLVWPAFVLGAGAQELQTREDVRNIMHNIWVSSCCYNVRTALWMLERIWEWGQDGNEGRNQSWLRFIWEQGESWLFL
ncbi:uncharacterized protein FFB20_14994 [Fusarium fujikuroi]|nr:uncharacterized protein Y057_10594 [Fusarium fujikuroi]SCN76524.1 uncharacterized protein FFC1_02325 [Fusarium fujikuroi]SCN87363.1 uncharacterized protein FFE2_06382 [Fusarium fujikuroi]SCO16427.1 uncharacterized protein FFB20_14994 [Fusarium fujikuroi]SCO31094.1 uncharacterized protein FFNC_01786 [Fusarium fujikuroi]